MRNPNAKHVSDRHRSGNLVNWRLSEGAETVATSGTLHERMAGRDTGAVQGRSSFLADDNSILADDEFERTFPGEVTVTRSATGSLSIRSGRLREVLAAAEEDALARHLRLKREQSQNPTEGGL